jgi:hypothetical protein
MDTTPLMQRALDSQWEQLPPALQRHYMHSSNMDVGTLDISYPKLMQPYLNLLRLLGALVNRKGNKIPTTVSKRMEGDIQYWERTICFPDGKGVLFKSRWEYAGGNEFIEYVNSYLGLRMAVYVDGQQLHYSGRHYVFRLGLLRLPIPECLVLGHTTIVERAVGGNAFAMDFRLRHPWFGELFRYAGEFRTERPA